MIRTDGRPTIAWHEPRRERTLAEYRAALAADPNASFYVAGHRASCPLPLPDCNAAHPGGRLPERPSLANRIVRKINHREELK